MNYTKSELDAAFIERQRRTLLALRAQLASVAEGDRRDESLIKEEGAARPREYEDDAQKLAALELDGNLRVRDASRLAQVDRALEKIAQGTYGFSDLSGAAIARERLEAIPEAVCTLAEQGRYEAGDRGIQISE
jgi:DnaK suppressor protein